MTCSPERESGRWDIAIAIATALFLGIYAYEPLHLWPGVSALTLTWQRALALLVVVVISRHLRHPHPSLPSRLLGGVRRRLFPEGSPAILAIALSTRAAVIGAGLAASMAAGTTPPGAPRVADHVFWNLPARWDALWYLSIADHGYDWDPARSTEEWNVAFFPAFPVLMRVAGNLVTMPGYWLDDSSIFGGTAESRLLFGGWLLSVLAFTWALANLYALARDDLGPARAYWALLLLACFPFALFYSAPYSEGVFLLALTSAFLAARQHRPVATFLWGALVALTRQTGVLVAVPLVLLALSRARTGDGSARVDWRLLAAAAGPAVGLGVHVLNLWWQVGDPFAWVKAQEGWWHSASSAPFYVERVAHVRDLGFGGYLDTRPGHALATFVPMFAAVLLWRMWRLSPAYAALVVVTLVPAVAIDTPSMGRLAAPLFPLFIALAAILPDRKDAWVLAGAFFAAQLWAAFIFFEWGMLY